MVAAEFLESRALLATITWGNSAGGNWNVGSNWVGGSAPGSNDDAIIPDLPGSPTITFNTGSANPTVRSLTISEAFVISGGTFNCTNISQLAGSFTLSGGTLDKATLVSGTLTVSASPSLGSVTIANGASLNVLSNATPSLTNSDTLTIYGNATLNPNSTLTMMIQGGWTTSVNVYGTVTVNQATITDNSNSGTTKVVVNSGGRLVASNSSFNMDELRLSDGAVLNSVDWSGNNFFKPIWMPAVSVKMLSAANGGSDNKQFSDVNVIGGTLNSGALNFSKIGTVNTANLRYLFDGNVTIASSATFTVAQDINWFVNLGYTLTISGTATFNPNSTLNLSISGGWTTAVVINGTVTATQATITDNSNSGTTRVTVNTGGRLIASNSSFNMDELRLNDGAVLNATDWSNNSFFRPIWLPAVSVKMLSAATGGSDNKQFSDINIVAGTLNSGTLSFAKIGTVATANLRYRFDGNVTIASAATFNVAQDVSWFINLGYTLTVTGTATLNPNSTLNMSISGGWTTALVINGTVTATQATVTDNSNSGTTRVSVNTGGRLIATNSTFSMDELRLNDGAVLNATDWSGNSFFRPIWLPAVSVKMLSAANGGSDNKQFSDVNVIAGTLNSGVLNFSNIGTVTTANLRYLFDGNVTIASAATFNVAQDISWFINLGYTLTVSGTATFNPNSTLNMSISGGWTTALVINGTVTATQATITDNSNSGTTRVTVNTGGRLIATNSTFSMDELRLNDGAILNSTDWSGNSFFRPIWLPAVSVKMLSATNGGSDNKQFSDVNVIAGTLSSGTLNFSNIGTVTTANLRYLFDGNVIIASGATFNVTQDVSWYINLGYTLTVSGTATLNPNSTLNMSISGGWTTALVINGTVTATQATITDNSNSGTTRVTVNTGGRLIATNSTFSMDELRLNDGAILNSTDWSGNSFFRPIWLPAASVKMLSAVNGGSDNKQFSDVNVIAGTLSSGSLKFSSIGTVTTANLRYLFDGNVTIASGATFDVAQDVSWYINLGYTLTIGGTATLNPNSTLNMSISGGWTTALVINGTVTATQATITDNSNSGTTRVTVNTGGRLIAANSTFNMDELRLNDGAILNATDWSNNSFVRPIWLPAASVKMLSAANGGRDNKQFSDVNIIAGTLNSGTLNFSNIGTVTTANLRYLFDGNVTIASGAAFNVAQNIGWYINLGYTLTINGAAVFNPNSTLNLSISGGWTTAITINGSLDATNANLVETSTSGTTRLTVGGSGRLTAVNTNFAVEELAFASGANVQVSSNDGGTREFGRGGSSRTLTNYRSIDLAYGANVSAQQGLQIGSSIADPAELHMSYSSTLAISGSLSGKTRTPANFTPLGRVLLNSGNTSTPQLVEIMGADVGATSAGFTNNFAYGRLELSNNTFARLTNADSNWSDGRTEAIYINTLIVGTGAKLDLANQKIYVRAFQNAGTIVNGTVNALPTIAADGGPLAFATPTPGTIDTGTADTWTFTSNQNGPVMIQVNPGAAGTTAAVPTVLKRVRIELLNASDTVLKVVENDADGNLVTLSSDPLTSGQNFKIRVKAHSSFPNLAGNYVITLVNANATETAISITPDATSSSKFEGNSGATDYKYNITRFGDLTGAASISWTVTATNPTNASDFVGNTVPSGTVTFANSSEVTKTITISVLGDTNFESDESFSVNLSNPTTLMSITQGSVTSLILNDDQPVYSDLVVSAIAPPTAAQAGQRITLGWTEKNIGSASAVGTWSTLVSVVNRNTGQTVYSQTTIFSANSIASQASVDRSLQFDLPNGAAGEGTYDVTISVDSGKNITEANANDTAESNNTTTSSFVAGPGIYPDLTVAEVTAPASIQLNIPFDVSWKVNNIGTAPQIKSIRDRVYLSLDGLVDGSDRILGTVDNSAKLPVAIGSNYTQQLSVTLPLDSSIASGTYNILVVTDFANEQFETVETNNTFAKSTSISLPPLPDLIVTSIQTRDLVVAGQTVPVTWIVKNQGTAAATGTWSDRVLLSDDAFVGNDLSLSTFPVTTTILPDGTIERTQEVAIPAGLSGVYHFVIATDTFSQVEEFNRENNNTAIDDLAITIDSRPSPNLVVDSVTGLTSNLFSGQPATIEWVVRNVGNASTNSSAWEDRVYLSNDPIFSNDDAFLGRVINPSYLNSSEVYRSSLTASLPEDAVGGRYFIVVTDATNAVSETAGENDNTHASALSQITLTPPADLFVTSVDAAQNGIEGELIFISWVVKNQGTGPTRVNQWVDQVYLSLNGRDIDASDSLLATVTHTGSLAVNETYSLIQYSALLPENRVADEAYIIVRTDASRKVYEHSFEGNNDTSADRATRVIARTRPDLIVESINAPSNATAGQPLPISFTVSNPTGTATRQSVWQDSVYLSTDNQLSLQNDLLLGTRSRTGILPAGQSETRNFNFSLPNTLAGSYFVIVVTDSGQQVQEALEDNNTSSSTNSINIVINPPDLAVTSLSVGGTPLAGRELTVNYAVTNQGGSPTPVSAWNDAIYLSTDDRWDSNDRLVTERLRSGALAVGNTDSRAVNVRLPVDWIGSGYLLVRSDSRDDVYELNNDNNSSALATVVGDDRPDLTVTAFEPRLGSRELRPGATLTFDFEVTNRGLGPTYGQSWTDRLVLSSDLILGNSDDIWLAALAGPRDLLAGQTYSRVSQNVVIPATTPEGAVRLFLVADATGQVGETNESNNSLASVEFTITNSPGSDAQLSDLTVVALTAPTTLVSGNNLPISWTVRNVNFATTNTSIWYDDVWLSKDTVIDSNDISVGRYLHNTALASNQQYIRSINYPVGIDMEGTYFVIISTDATNRVIEGFGEANNQRFSTPATTVTLSPVPDLRVSTITPPATAFSGRGTPLSWTVENAGGRSADAPWLDRAFLSLDQIYDPASDVPVGFVERTGALANGANYTATTNVNIPTGIGGNYYVIVVTDSSDRVYERALENNNVTVSTLPISISHLPPADLVVGDITIPVNGELNQNATINFTVANNGAFAARGGWFDSIYFSSDDTWDIGDGYFGRVQHTADVAAGASYNATLTAPLPGVLPGNYKVIIRSDIRNNVLEANETNNLKGTLNSVALDAPALTLGVARTGTVNKGGAVYYKVTVPAGETVAIEFDGLVAGGATELYSSFGAMPRRSQADHVALRPYEVDQRIVISSTLGGTYYILAVAQDMEASSSNYSIIARVVPFSVFDTNYGQGGTAGFRTIAINGAKFDRSVTADLVDARGQASPAVRYYRTSDTQLFATFDLRSLARGNYSVRLHKTSTAENVVVTNALQVVFAITSQDPLSLTRPDTFNRRRDDRAPAIIPVSLGWRNTTLNDVPVPLIHFSATDPFALTLEDAKEGRTIDTTEFLGFPTDDGPRDILMPGEAVSVDFFIAPRAVAANSPTVDIHYVAEYFYNVSDAGYPWDFDLSQLDMSYLSDDQAIGTIAAFQQAYSNSVGAYRAALVDALQRSGEATPQNFAAANRYLLQNVFDRFVASRETSLVGQLNLLNANVDFEELVITLTEIGSTRDFTTRALQDGSFVLATLPAGEYDVRVTGGAVKAADNLKVVIADGEHAAISIPLSAAAFTAADAVSERIPVGTSPITAPQITLGGKINETLTGNVLDKVMAQLAGLTYRVELVGEAPVGFTLRPDGSYSYLSNQTHAFVVHYDLVLPDRQTRVGRLFAGEVRSRGVLAITLKNNFTRDVRARDPNDILGPDGYGDQKWVSANERLQYKVRFENDPKQASSPAGSITIEQTLDSDLDASTVEFGSFTFGGREFTVHNKQQSLNFDLDMRTELGIYVRVFAFVDVASRKLSWTFSSISPETGTDITDPSQGFLPLNEAPPQGDGSVSYSVKAKRSAITGAVIDAQARIIFDGNAAIDTPSIFNTLDVTRPISKIASAEVDAVDSRINVAWDGEDGEGAGLSTFDVYVSANGGSYQLWLKDTTLLESRYDAIANWNYSFVTIARDHVGNSEPASKLPDAARPVATIVGTYQLREGVSTRLTGSGQDPDGVLTSFLYEWDFDYDGGAFQVNATSATPDLLVADGPATRTIALRVKGTAADAAYSLITTSVVTVDNVAPTVTRLSSSVSAFVNTELRNSGTWQDSVSDIVTLSASLGSVVLKPDGTWSWTYVSTTARANETVTITAVDEDNASSSVTFTITAAFNPATFLPQLSSPVSGLTNVRAITLQLDFGSPVINFTADDLDLINATAVTLTDMGNGKFNIDVEATLSGTVSVALLANRVIDGQGRSNQATAAVSWQYVDTTAMDFGDAPDSSLTGFPQSYPTLLANDGARHKQSSLRLGASFDVETDGQPAALAQGDDINGNSSVDDEDGIVFAQPILSSSAAATVASFVATASADGKLDGWIDFNRDGDWNDVGEQIAINVPVSAGVNLIPFSVPAGAFVGDTYARFRISTQGNLLPTGSADDGEVEDHAVAIASVESPTDLVIDSQLITAHRLEVINNQLTLTANSRVFFQAIVSSIRRVSYVAASGSSEIYAFATPATSLFGALVFVSLSEAITVQSTRTSVDLSSFGEQIYGVTRVELTSSDPQKLSFNEAAIKRLNSAGRLQIVTGDKDTIPIGVGWEYASTRSESTILLHTFATKSGTSIEVQHTWAWQNALNPNDAKGNGSVEPFDALLVINQINLGSHLPQFDPDSPNEFFFADTSGDGFLSPIDALLIINEINSRSPGGEGEEQASSGMSASYRAQPMAPDIVDALIGQVGDWSETASQKRRRRF